MVMRLALFYEELTNKNPKKPFSYCFRLNSDKRNKVTYNNVAKTLIIIVTL